MLEEGHQVFVIFTVSTSGFQRIEVISAAILGKTVLLAEDLIDILNGHTHLQHSRQRLIHFTVILFMHVLHENLRLRQLLQRRSLLILITLLQLVPDSLLLGTFLRQKFHFADKDFVLDLIILHTYLGLILRNRYQIPFMLGFQFIFLQTCISNF